ncbi:type IV pilin protein [Nocardioides sp. GXZ039]|uniref:type IV pilin protein n=1 Tax=Nocardioides sp. GXZ039 TaxID=3136018 RepID=UPI0030F3C00E
MINRLQKSMDEKDKGFTLVELLVVIVIIGILAAIAIPLFLNQREKGVEAGMKSDLKSLATLEETYFVDNGKYSANVSDFAPGATGDYNFKQTGANQVTVVSANVDGFCLHATNTDYTDLEWWYDSQDGGLKDTAC